MARPVFFNPRASAESLHSIHSVLSTTSTVTKDIGLAVGTTNPPLQPTGASSTHFLFAQGRSVLCIKHDTLELDRRFERHSENVTLISVDNSSELGYGRVVSIDGSKEAIVWDFRDGEELHRFNPFEEIRVASWMRNGNLSLGDCKGNVIVFNPSQGDSILSRTISNPLCALAPSADCTTFALGYNNGSILVATLTPFTILYTLTTSSLSPSPIAALAWHTSSSKQKSDMLTTQTRDGDLRVWSVAKTIESGEPAKVVRVLNKEGGNKKGNNWCAWSMKGRVIQYSEGETTIWDVRNKKIYLETVPTPANLAGIAVYGPKGSLFTITNDHTVQQYELYPPAVVTSVQHLPTVPPPSPPSSIEEKKEKQQQQQQQEDPAPQIERLNPRDHEYNIATMSPLGRIAHELELLEKMEAQGLGISNLGSQSMQRTPSVSSRTTISTVSRRPSVASTRSAVSIDQVSISDQRSIPDMSDYDMNTPVARNRKDSLGRGSIDHGILPSPGRKPHPLAQEIIASPIEQAASRAMLDLFGNIRARLPFVVNDSPRVPASGKKDESDLRREMLYTIFGWRGDVDGLIRDELDSVDSRSLTAVMLRMWLGELDQNSLSVLLGADFMVSADWLFLALSAMDGKKAWDTVARAMVMRLMQKDDIHTAAVVLLALGNAKDAVDIYVTHNMHMEAVILAAYLWKNDWKKLSQLVRKWGEFATTNHDSSLAARCFACCGAEAPEELQSPITPVSHKRQKSDTESISSFIRNLPAAGSRASLRLVTSTSPLKLITTFPTPDKPTPDKTGNEKEKDKPSIASRFFGWANDKHSMKSPAQTPIAQSAVSPTEQWKAFPVFPRGTPRLPSVDEAGSEETPRQRHPSQGLPYETKLEIPKIESKPQVGLPYETKLDIPKGAASAPKDPSMSITSPVGNSKEFGSILADKLSRPTAPVTLGQQLSRSGTPSGTPQQKQGPFNENIFRTGTPGRSPSGSPQIGSGGWDRAPPVRRQGPPAGLQIHFPTMDGILNGDTELPPPVIKPARNPTRSSTQRNPQRASGRRGSGRESDDSLPDIDEGEEGRSRSRRRRGSPDRRGRSYSRRPGEGSHVRSPSSPLPFSPQADFYREKEPEDHPRGRREVEEERGRGRSRSIQGGSIIRSPSSPLPMSPEAHLYRDEEDDAFDESYYTRARSQARARSHARMESRARSRARDVSRPRAESTVRGESRVRVREESRPRVREESRPRVREESRPRVREESRPRVREESRPRVREESRPRMRDESRPRIREESRPRIREESRPRLREESRSRGESRARSRQPEERGRSTIRVPNMMRSPSSPLPMSPEAAFYRYDEDESDEAPIRARSRLREESRPRGRRREESVAREGEPAQIRDTSELRRSRSERTLNAWVKQFERSASVDRRPSVPELPSRAMSIRGLQGLPATPKAWKGPLSRAQSPAATPSRGRSPAPGRSPLIGTPLTASSLNEALSVLPRSVLGSGRAMSPAPRTTIAERARSQSRGPSSLQNTPQLGHEASFGETRGMVPQIPPVPNAQRSQSVSGHSRMPSMQGKHVPTPLKNIAFYPTPKSQAPGSPPPLPIDMPVHPALQLNLPSINGTTKISAGPNSSFRLGGRGAVGHGNGNGSVDLGNTIDSVLVESPTSRAGMNHNNLIISIGMSKTCLEEEAKTGRMSPPINTPPTNGDPRLGTPL